MQLQRAATEESAIYFFMAKNTMRRIARRKSKFSTRINGMYCDNFDGSATGSSGGFGDDGRAALGGAHGCMVCGPDLCVFAELTDQI